MSPMSLNLSLNRPARSWQFVFYLSGRLELTQFRHSEATCSFWEHADMTNDSRGARKVVQPLSGLGNRLIGISHAAARPNHVVDRPAGCCKHHKLFLSNWFTTE